jgi:hypothetical protein
VIDTGHHRLSILTIMVTSANARYQPGLFGSARPANGRNRREGDSRDAPPDGQFATAETGRVGRRTRAGHPLDGRDEHDHDARRGIRASSKRDAQFGRGRPVAPDTFIRGSDPKAHPHYYRDLAGLAALFAGFELLSLTQEEQRRPGSWHWHILAERR